MNIQTFYELLGYAGSLVILVSLVMTNVFRLRIINLIGSAALAIYGGLIGAIPVCAINAVIVGVDAWYILQAFAVSAFFELDPVSSVGCDYFKRFFLYRERDIHQSSPGLTIEELQEAQTFILFRNLLPVGIFSFRQNGSEARIVTDYMIPEYRDFKAGRFLFNTRRMFFKEQGIKKFIAVTTQPQQVKYLLKSGFTRDEQDDARYLITL